MFLVVSEVQGGQNRVRHVQIHPWEASNAPGTDLRLVPLHQSFPATPGTYVVQYCIEKNLSQKQVARKRKIKKNRQYLKR